MFRDMMRSVWAIVWGGLRYSQPEISLRRYQIGCIPHLSVLYRGPPSMNEKFRCGHATSASKKLAHEICWCERSGFSVSFSPPSMLACPNCHGCVILYSRGVGMCVRFSGAALYNLPCACPDGRYLAQTIIPLFTRCQCIHECRERRYPIPVILYYIS